jgi:phosphodiesterase/alkaline phosphatase D-like protein
MDRRSLLKLSVLAVGTGLSRPTFAKAENAVKCPFTNGVAAAKQSDGSWNLLVRAAAHGARPAPEVNVRMEVATDAGFTQIVSTRQLVAHRGNSYIIRTNYQPKFKGSVLYFRFVLLDHTGHVIKSAKGQDIVSRTERLDPWAT